MQRAMRRLKQELPAECSEKILREGKYAVMALLLST
jgi:hypothetical protein